MSERIISKRCSSCKQTKPLFEFPKCRSGKDGYHNQCKVCKNGGNRAYRQTKKGKEAGRRSACKWHQSPKGKAYDKQYQHKPTRNITGSIPKDDKQ